MLHTVFSLFQKPFGTPNPDDDSPLDLSDPFNLIVFIILPIIMVVFYIVYRKNRRKERDGEQ